MEFQRSQTQFDSLGQWHAWRLGLDMAPPRPEAAPDELICQLFIQDLLADLFAHPEAYGVPHAAYEPTIPSDTVREDHLREGRRKVRKAIEDGLLDFLFQIGQAGEIDGQALRVARPFYDTLVSEKTKKAKLKGCPQSLERLGMSFTAGEDVVVSNARYPGLPAALSPFAKACVAIPEHGFYFFRRGDFGVFDQKCLPTFEDGLSLLPDGLRREAQQTDALLNERKFKRKLFVGDGDAGYRMRYQKKAGKITYWSRIMSWSSITLDHNLRWDFASDVTARLFARLDITQPGLAEQIVDGIKKCAHCYENCMVRKQITYHGRTQEVCQEVGWETVGEQPEDFANLRFVLGLLDELAS